MSLDFFALLQEERRPWVEPEPLKEKFVRLSSSAHPDRVHGGTSTEREDATSAYAALNQAYNVLREPKDRLIHLLELEQGAKPRDIQKIPPGTMDLFVEVGQVCRDADALLARKSTVSSPMLKVKLFEEGLDFTDKLQNLQQRIHERQEQLVARLKDLNLQWQKAPPIGDARRPGALPLEELENIYRSFSYVTRWTAQIQERLVQLAS